MAVAFLFGTWLALREAKRLHLDSDKLVSVILVALVAGVLGARMLYVLEHVSEFRREWGSVLALWQGGLTLYGGFTIVTVKLLLILAFIFFTSPASCNALAYAMYSAGIKPLLAKDDEEGGP